MSPKEEKIYAAGTRAAVVTMLKFCARQLGVDDLLTRAAGLLAEREQAHNALRRICARYGDLDWKETISLVDVLTNSLERHLDEAFSATNAPILVWTYDAAPERYRGLFPRTGDEDWIAVIPPGAREKDPGWAWEGTAFGRCGVAEHICEDGTRVLRGKHA
jgi:hypothetical protein